MLGVDPFEWSPPFSPAPLPPPPPFWPTGGDDTAASGGDADDEADGDVASPAFALLASLPEAPLSPLPMPLLALSATAPLEPPATLLPLPLVTLVVLLLAALLLLMVLLLLLPVLLLLLLAALLVAEGPASAASAAALDWASTLRRIGVSRVISMLLMEESFLRLSGFMSEPAS